MIMPALVGDMVSVGTFVPSLESALGCDTAAKPKSSTFTTPSGVIITLAGLNFRSALAESLAAVHRSGMRLSPRLTQTVKTQLTVR
jgi:hypothetical protein